MNSIEILNYRGFDIAIYVDECPENPREWDNLGKILYSSDRYTLGDINTDNMLEYFNNEYSIVESEGYSLTEAEEVRIKKWVEKNIVMFPVYAYIHSGIALKMSGFSCPWDSGQSGVVYATKQRIRDEYSIKRITKKIRDKVRSCFEAEIQVFSDYLNGSVYYYSIEDENGENVDSCGGYFGFDWGENGLLEGAQNAIDYHIHNKSKEHCEYVKAMIRNHVPLHRRKPAPNFAAA